MLSKKLKNHFKDENEDDYRQIIDSLSKRIEKLEGESRNQNEVLESYFELFSNLFLNCELNAKGILKQVQDLNFEILLFVDEVCRKHGLDYWMDYGALLGAVRHHGYIPWDDDLDIGMMRKDYNELVDVLEGEIKKANLENFNFRFMKGIFRQKTAYRWVKVYYNFEGFKEDDLACLDIFPYDYIKDENVDNLDDIYLDCRGNFHQQVRDGVPFEEVLRNYFECLNLNMEREDNFIMGVEGVRSKVDIYPIQILDTDRLFPLKEVEFNGHSFPAPNDTPYYLKEIYGDGYLEIPKKIHNHDIASQLRLIEGIEDVLDRAIQEMKEVNENFDRND